MLCQSPLLRGLPIHVVMIGADTGSHRQQLAAAATRLGDAGYQTEVVVLAGEVEDALLGYQQEHQFDLLAMGAYGHSRIREFFIGDRKSTRLNSSHVRISYAVFCLKK